MTTLSISTQFPAAGSTLHHVLLALLCADTDPQPTPRAPHRISEGNRDIRDAQDGDPDAYARLIKKHQDQVAKRMWKFTRNRTDYEELVHQVFVEAYFALPRYREMNSFPAWLNRIATRVGYQYWKRQKKSPQHLPLEDWDTPTTTDPDHAADQLHHLLAQLGPRDRLVLTLIYWEGCSTAEAAQQTGWSQTLVKVQAHRARARLRKLIEKNQPETKP